MQSDGTGLVLLSDCQATATSGGCKPYEDVANSLCQPDAGPLAKCFATDPETLMINLAATFCGGS